VTIVAPVPTQRGSGSISPLSRDVIHTGLGMWLLLSGYPVYRVYGGAAHRGRSAMADRDGRRPDGLVGGLLIIGRSPCCSSAGGDGERRS
jgi:hypothetical protein